MELVTNKMKEASQVHDKCKQLLPSIWKLCDTYKYEIGFIQKPSYLVTFILVTGLFLLLQFSLNTLQAIGSCIAVMVIYWVYGYFKIKAKKVY